ncbi:MAG: ABC transporter permease [Anaerovoracaceae bacterium]
MNVFKKTTIGSLKKRKMRTRVTIVGVILFVATITAIVFFAASLHTYIKNDIIASGGNWSVAVENLHQGEVEAIVNTSDQGQGKFGKVTTIGYGHMMSTDNTQKPYIYVGSYENSMKSIGDINVKEGRLPKNDREIIVSEHLIDQIGKTYSIGSEITLDLGNRVDTAKGVELGQFDRYNPVRELFVTNESRSYKIVGVCSRTPVEPYLAPGYVAITKGGVPVAASSYTFLIGDEYKDFKKYVESNPDSNYKLHLNEELLGLVGEFGDSKLNKSMFTLCAASIILIFFGASMLLYNAFRSSAIERRRQLGIFATVGATGRQLRYTTFYEGLHYGKYGIPIGIILGLIETKILIEFLTKFTSTFRSSYGTEFVLVTPLEIFLMVIGLSCFLIFISILMPSIEVSRIDPLPTEGDIYEQCQGEKYKTGKGLLQRKFGSPLDLGQRNYKRNRKQYSTATISLILSIVVFLGTSSFSYYLRANMNREYLDSMAYDITYEGANPVESEGAFVKLQGAEGVGRSIYYHVLDLLNPRGSATDKIGNYEVAVLDDESMRRYLAANRIDRDSYFNSDRPKFIAVENLKVFDRRTGSYKREKLYKYNKKPSTINSYYKGDIVRMNIGAYVEETPEGVFDTVSKPMLVVSKSASAKILKVEPGDGVYSAALFKSEDPESTYDAMKIIIRESNLSASNLNNIYDSRNGVLGTILVLKIFSYGFIVLLSLIAIANVINTISSNIQRRRHEFATYITLGMSISDLKKMLEVETMYLAARALILGIPSGILVTILVHIRTLSKFGISYSLPVGSIIVCIIAVLLIVIVTMIYTTNKLKAKNLSHMAKNINF